MDKDMFQCAIEHIEKIMENLPDEPADPIYEKFFHAIPLPCWIKVYEEVNGGFRMLSLNDAYLGKYGMALREYIGKMDRDIWPTDVAKLYRTHDLEVLESGKAEYCIEEAKGDNILVLKFPFEILGMPAVAGLVLGVLP